MNESIFKAYDIRGIYPSEIDEETVYKIGCAVVSVLGAKKLAVGRDVRDSSPTLYDNLIKGITDAGCDVVSLGVLTTPMVYFASGRLDVDGAISVTASHNPAQYNGIKIARKNAIPVGSETGLTEIKELVIKNSFPEVQTKGAVIDNDITKEYYDTFSEFAHFGDKKFTIITDTANTMGVLELEFYKRFPQNITLITLYDDLEHPFTAHEANPLNLETLSELQERVIKEKADIGIAYDGDADRIGFVDETGAIIPMDLVTGLIAQILLKENPGGLVLYDLRSSDAVRDAIGENGGRATECRVGHSFIKKQMREEKAIFAGELSGHYYFQQNYNAEMSTLAAFMLLNLMTETDKKISELVSHLRRYHHSGEINSEVKDKDATLQKLKENYADGKLSELDGIKIRYPDWWLNVRPSNTEPVLRLNVEAKTQELMEQKRDEILAIIRS